MDIWVQRRWVRAVAGLEDLSCSEMLNGLNLFSFQGQLLRNDLRMFWKIFNGKYAVDPNQLFTLGNSVTRGHAYKIFLPQSNLEVESGIFHIWNSLGADTVSSGSLEAFKNLLQRDLGQRLFQYLD